MPETVLGTVNIKEEEHSYETYLHFPAGKTDINQIIVMTHTAITGFNGNIQ